MTAAALSAGRPWPLGASVDEHGVNVAGGLHHAMPGAGSGFCVYNDPAVAIAWMLEQGTRLARSDSNPLKDTLTMLTFNAFSPGRG